MECSNCGAELSPEDKFCGECGAPRPEAPAPTVEAQPAQAQPPPPVFAAPEPGGPTPGKRSRRKWVAIGCLGLLAVVCILAALLGGSLLRRLSEPLELTITLPGVPSPSPTAQGGIELFSCTSDDLDCGWDAHSYESGEAYAVGHELFLVAKGPFGLAETEIPAVEVQDFSLYFVAELSSESGYGSYGAAIRCHPDNHGTFYEFQLFPNGEYKVWEWVDYEPTMIDSGTAELDPSGEDSIAIFARGPTVSFLVNAGPQTEITDAELREGPIRLLASVVEETEIEVAVSYVVVEAL